jgi:NitT/TauT family transport system permease protein
MAGIVVWWQAIYWLLGNVALTSPVETLVRLWQLLRTDWFWGDILESLHAMTTASIIVIVFGCLFGVALGLHRLSASVAEPIIVTLYSIPKVTLYPIVLLIFGLTISARIAFGVMHGILPLMLFTMAAVRNVSQVLVRSAQVMHLSRWAIITSVVIPAALPGIVTGLRIGVSVTLLGVLLGEMFASKKGLGFRLMNGIQNNDTATIMAIAVLVSVFALTVNYLLLLLAVRQRARMS